MHALTVKQPWAQAIARFGKTVENRERKPPERLLGKRVAIHVSQASDEWDHFPREVRDYLDRTLAWMQREHGAAWWCSPPPHAGHIIATARLLSWVKPLERRPSILLSSEWGFADDEDSDDVVDILRACRAAVSSPWFTGPVGWVLADVRMLTAPVGPVRGWPQPFALSLKIRAAVIAAGG